HHARQPVPLQLRPHPRHAQHHTAGTDPEPEQPHDPVAHAAGGGEGSGGAGGGGGAGAGGAAALGPAAPPGPAPPSSPSPAPPSSVISFRNAMSLSASSGVIPAILSTSSRSRSRMSCSVLWPARASTSTSSAGSPLSSRNATLVAASSSGGRGANSGPSPPRSSHSRLEYRSIFQPVSPEARRTFCPLRPIASDSWSSST